MGGVAARPQPKTGGGISPAARHAVERRKREYRKKKEDLEDILITRPGTYLGRTGERLLIRHEGKREAEIPLSLIHSINLLTTACSLSGEIMAAAAARSISIYLLGSDGKPSGRIGGPAAPQHHLSLAHSRLAARPDCMELARII